MEKLSDVCAEDDMTAKFSESGSLMDSSQIRRRRLSFSAPSASAFLTPAFDACASATPQHASSCSGGGIDGFSLDIDASLLRYTRSGPYLPHSVTDSSNQRSASTLRRLQRIRYLRSMSPLSPIENIQWAKSPPMDMTPVKLEMGEDVVVMDGVPVSNAGSSTRPKTEVCRAWDENGVCLCGSQCQFAHGKEKMRSNHPLRHKTELSARRSHWKRSPFCPIPEAVEPFSPSGGTTTDVASSPSAIITPLTAVAECKKLELCGISTPISVEPQMPDEGAEATEGTTSDISPHPIKTLLAAETGNMEKVNPLSSPMSAMPSFQWPLTETEDNEVAQILRGERDLKFSSN